MLEHYHSFYKYAQFLYDGIFIEEPEYKFFEVLERQFLMDPF